MPPHAISIRISLFFNSTCRKFDIIVMKWNFYFHLLNERMSRFVLLFVYLCAASNGVEYLKWFAIGVLWLEFEIENVSKLEMWELMNSAQCTMIKCKILMSFFFGERKNCNALNGTFRRRKYWQSCLKCFSSLYNIHNIRYFLEKNRISLMFEAFSDWMDSTANNHNCKYSKLFALGLKFAGRQALEKSDFPRNSSNKDLEPNHSEFRFGTKSRWWVLYVIRWWQVKQKWHR